jgi:hypothetical protein
MSTLPQVEAAAAAVAPDAVKLADGAATLAEWLGEGATPVAQELAQARANVCLACPANSRKTMWSWLTVPVANTVLRWMKYKSHLKLKVDGEEALGTCSSCLCHLPVKIWCPLDHIKSHMDARVLNQLPTTCWVRTETKP